MKRVLAMLAVMGYATSASAVCPSNTYPIRVTDFTGIEGTQIDANAPDGENWKELHCPSGDLQKVGVSKTDAVDPQTSVGSWNINDDNSANATLTYDYGTGGRYTWRLYANFFGGFCWQENNDSGAEIARGTIIIPGVGCNIAASASAATPSNAAARATSNPSVIRSQASRSTGGEHYRLKDLIGTSSGKPNSNAAAPREQGKGR